MRFSDFTQFHLPEPIKYANSDSPPFNSDESPSDDESSKKPLKTTTCNCPPPSSNNISPIKLFGHSPFKQILITHHTDISIDKSRHLSQDQSNSHPPPLDRTTKTQYPLRRQPQLDYRLFIPHSKLHK